MLFKHIALSGDQLMDNNKSALLVMGCPEVPVQTSVALYLSNKLNKAGHDVVVAGTDAALKLLKVSSKKGPKAERLVYEEPVDYRSMF